MTGKENVSLVCMCSLTNSTSCLNKYQRHCESAALELYIFKDKYNIIRIRHVTNPENRTRDLKYQNVEFTGRLGKIRALIRDDTGSERRNSCILENKAKQFWQNVKAAKFLQVLLFCTPLYCPCECFTAYTESTTNGTKGVTAFGLQVVLDPCCCSNIFAVLGQ